MTRHTALRGAVVRPCLLLGSAAFVVLALSPARGSPDGHPAPGHKPGLHRAATDRAIPDKTSTSSADKGRPNGSVGTPPAMRDNGKPDAAKPSPGAKPPNAPKPDPLQETSKALRIAHKPAEARALERRAETLRQKNLSASTRLLLENADSSLKAHDYRKAEAALDNALVLQPDKPFIRRGRARVRYAAGDFEGAISDLGVALQKDPDDPLSWQLLSQVEEERHDLKAALQAARQLLVVDPLASGGAKRVKALQAQLDGRAI
ncbi:MULTISPECIES: tetratricopeptide repeat protein [Asaia]|uniref:tetratricopeptide repeat protein n=1 Tax=Asaia TaxID=91914 RepID=UPI002554FAFC|nr:tetratricopeptide repeat protein [Asaia sp. HumB]MDL2170992.1 tetratricopeptide repeat protein [Asaia sp. HumB]